MNQIMQITLDGVTYNVGVEYQSLERSFEIQEGSGKGTAASGSAIRDLIGTFYSYKLKIRALPENQVDYDNFYIAVSRANNIHTITLPFGQDNYTFNCYIDKGTDVYEGYYASYNRWDELDLTIEPVEARFQAEPVVPPGTYILEYDKNTDVTVYDMPSRQTSDDGWFTVSYKTPRRSDGTDFLGWAVSSSGSVSYFSGEDFCVDTQSIQRTTTLYAVWALKHDYSLYLNPNYSGGVEELYEYPVVQSPYETPIMPYMLPERLGYTFKYWCTDSSDSGGTRYNVGDLIEFSASRLVIRLYAIWVADEVYGLEYDSNPPDGVSPDSITNLPTNEYKSISNFVVSANLPELVDYNFLGWNPVQSSLTASYVMGDSIDVSESMYTINNILKLFAIWRRKTRYTLYYRENAGSDTITNMPPTDTNTTGVFYIPYIIPKRENPAEWEFLGWANSANATEADYTFFSNTKNRVEITSGTTKYLYAIWVNKLANNYFRLEYNANGGNWPPNPVEQYGPDNYMYMDVSKQTDYPQNIRDGKVFAGWDENPNATTATYPAGVGGKVKVYANTTMTLYAVWQNGDPYALYYDGNTKDSSLSNMPTPNPQRSSVGSFVISNRVPTRDSFDFLAWSRGYELPGPTYLAGDTFTTTGSGLNWRVYAIWKSRGASHYTITYCPNGNSVTGMPEPVHNLSINGHFVISNAVPYRMGYEFLGWSTNQNATDGEYHYPDYYDAPPGIYNINLYAIWHHNEVITYTLSYYDNPIDGTQVTHVPSTQESLEGPEFRIPSGVSNTPVCSDPLWEFNGWYYSIDSQVYNPGDYITITGITATLFARWKAASITYTLSFDGNPPNGTTVDRVPSEMTDSFASFTIPSGADKIPRCSDSSYTFAGWYYSYNGQTYQPGASFIIQDGYSAELVARWNHTVVTYTLSYSGNAPSGTTVSNVPAQQGPQSTNSFTIPNTSFTIPVCSDSSYTFAGWYYSVDGQTYSPGASFSVKSGTSAELIAQWTRTSVTYTLAYSGNAPSGTTVTNIPGTQGPQASNAFTVPSGSANIPTCSDSSWAFAGWKLNNTGNTIQPGGSVTITSGTSGTMYAQWTGGGTSYHYELNYNSSPGSQGPSNESHNGNETSWSTTIPYTIPYKSGAVFLGWQDNSEKVYVPYDTVTLQSNDPILNVSAVYSNPYYTYAVHYMNDDDSEFAGDADTTPTSNTSKSFSVISQTPTKQGYQFVGWANSKNQSTAAYTTSIPVTANTVTRQFGIVWEQGTINTSTGFDTDPPSANSVRSRGFIKFDNTTGGYRDSVLVHGGGYFTGTVYDYIENSPTSHTLSATHNFTSFYAFLPQSGHVYRFVANYTGITPSSNLLINYKLTELTSKLVYPVWAQATNMLTFTINDLRSYNTTGTWSTAPYPSYTNNGMVFTFNTASYTYPVTVITANGNTPGSIKLSNSTITLTSGGILSGNPNGSIAYISCRNVSTGVPYTDNGSGVSLPAGTYDNFIITVYDSATNLQFTPQLIGS